MWSKRSEKWFKFIDWKCGFNKRSTITVKHSQTKLPIITEDLKETNLVKDRGLPCLQEGEKVSW